MPGWNPWHGCHKVSEGCRHCYVYALDAMRGRDAGAVTRNRADFELPVRRDRAGAYKLPPGSEVALCFTSDFFLPDADEWRPECWRMIAERRDCGFMFFTKRPERAAECLPPDWGGGWPNVAIGVSCENRRRTDERAPLLLDIPCARRLLVVAPMLERVDLRRWLATGGIDEVTVGGESYRGAGVTRFEDVLDVRAQCVEAGVRFTFHQTGSNFVKDGVLYRVAHAREREQARRAGIDWTPPGYQAPRFGAPPDGASGQIMFGETE